MGCPNGPLVKYLTDLGTPCAEGFVDGRSAFSWAVAGGYLGIVDIILEHDKELVNTQDRSGRCPLALAAQYEHLEVLDKLLSTENVNVNLRSERGTTAISYAIDRAKSSAKGIEIFRKLLQDRRVDITVRDDRGRSCLSYLAEYRATEAIRALLDCQERQEAVDQLLDDGGDKRCLSPLRHAAFVGHTEAVGVLCGTHKISRQLPSVDELERANVFHLAAKRQHAEVIRVLGDVCSAGLNGRDQTGRTPLSTAMWGSDPDVVRALLDCGADVNLPDYSGRTPASHGIDKTEMVRVLVEEYGADLNRPDRDGHTPLCYTRGKSDEVKEGLRNLGATMMGHCSPLTSDVCEVQDKAQESERVW